MSLLAIDIGSSTCKTVVFSIAGVSLAQHSIGYTPEYPGAYCAEINPEKIWDAVRTSCQAVTRELNDPVQALCLSSHGESFVPVDARGRPLMNAILNQDGRAARESVRCEDLIGRERLFQITGLRAHAAYPLPKILWLRQHRPEVFAEADVFLTVIGYLLQRMGLAPYVDYSLASRYLAFDVRERAWSDEILDAVEIDKARLPVPAPAGTTVGTLTPNIAQQFGVAVGTPVILGGHDQPCNALGSGVIGQGRVAHSIGSYECLVAVDDAPRLSEKAYAASLNSYCHVVPNRYVTLAYFPSGLMMKWFHDLLNADSSDQYAVLEARAPAGPTGLCITPHLVGSCNPEFDPSARGLMAGLTVGTDRAQIHKGILEGLACELSLLTETMGAAIGRIEHLYVTGGGARSSMGLQLRAALTGCHLHVMKQQEATCLGTAMLAGIAIGEYSDAAEAISAVVGESRVVAPDEGMARAYKDQFTRYRQLRSLMVGRQ